MAGRHTGGVRAVFPLAGSFVSLWLFQGYFMAAPWGGFFASLVASLLDAAPPPR
jgi:hypothetical protein